MANTNGSGEIDWGGMLEGQVALVTGASAGIGADCARLLAASGATVVLGARRLEKLEALKTEIEASLSAIQARGNVLALPLDVSSAASRSAFLAAAKRECGPCSILVNNAGVAKGRDSVADSDEDDWQTMLDTNVMGAFSMARQVLEDMRARGAGDIVNISSIAAYGGYAGGAVYCATKAALHRFSESLRHELLGQDIRVFSIDPGMVETDFSLARLGDESAAKAVYKGMRPLAGKDIAECVLFALSRPRHVNIDKMLVLATDQASATAVHRR